MLRMGYLQKFAVDCGIFLVKIGILIKRILVFIFTLLTRGFVWILKKLVSRPLVLSYKLHLKHQSRLQDLGLEIKNRFFYFFSSKTLVHIFILAIGTTVTLANIHNKETPPDILNPHNILSRVVPRNEDIALEEDIASTPNELEYSPLTGVKSSVVFAQENLEQQEEQAASMGQIALIPAALIKPTLPSTEQRIQEPSATRTYLVQSGDTLSDIASRFGLRVATILWANDLTENSTLRVGQRLVILPKDGILYRVKRGDTLEKIAHNYQSTVDKIVGTNSLEQDTLAIGQTLIIPDAIQIVPSNVARKKDTTIIGRIKNIFTPTTKKTASLSSIASLLWPTTAHRITQYFSWRHTGVDIAGPPSNKIVAAADGVVVISGWQRGYGNTIVIDHGNNKKTRYGHASKLYAKKGERVSRGETIAMVGSTGRSTGPHLHFEVLVGNRRVNPLSYIR